MWVIVAVGLDQAVIGDGKITMKETAIGDDTVLAKEVRATVYSKVLGCYSQGTASTMKTTSQQDNVSVLDEDGDMLTMTTAVSRETANYLSVRKSGIAELYFYKLQMVELHIK